MIKLSYTYIIFLGGISIKTYDLAIIGGGPIGLFAGYFANLHNLKTIIFESLNEVGGQASHLYPIKEIHDIPLFKSILAKDFIKQLTNNLSTEVNIRTNHKVQTIIKQGDFFLIDDNYLAKSVIIATGNGAFAPKKLPLKTTPEINKLVHYSLQDLTDFKNQNVAVFGGGDSALDWAIELAKVANVAIIHRRNEFRGLDSSVKKLKKLKNVEFLTPYLPKDIKMHDNQLLLALKKVGDKQIINETFDKAVVAYGFRANNDFVRQWGINLENRLISVNQKMQTNIEGIYAIGDAATYAGRVPLIALGFGEAQIAITQIMQNLFPSKSLTIHSTSI